MSPAGTKRHRPVIVLAALVAVAAANACTTFLLQDSTGTVFGRNYDWSLADGYLIVNKRQMAKTGLAAANPARWVSTYGSVTFNQFGREMPLGGTNEAGLVVEVMWLDEARYPEPGSLPAVNELQWVQYQLDNFATVKGVIAGLSQVTIEPGGATIHYLVADASGGCASIEFLDGRPVWRTGPEMPYKALANSTYDDSRKYLDSVLGVPGHVVPGGSGSLERFARAALLTAARDRYRDVPLVDHAFAILAGVALGTYTKWNVVYDITSRSVWFRTLHNQALRRLDLGACDFSGRTPVKAVDLSGRFAGDLRKRLLGYTYEANRALVFRVYRGLEFLRGIPDEHIERLARYPDEMRYVGR